MWLLGFIGVRVAGLRVACVGEVLYDSLPRGIYLGGAPLNVAMHAAQLGSEASMISAVGDDVVGRDAVRRLEAAGVESLVQKTALPTGFVTCTIDDNGDATYLFETPAAWDRVASTAEVRACVAQADAVVHGSLALRDDASDVATIVSCARRRVFDVNLRPPFVARERIEPLLADCWMLKMNEDEARQLATWCSSCSGEEEIRAVCDGLMTTLKPEFLVVTLAERGAVMLHGDDAFYETPGVRVDVVDTVGAGDAFTARLVVGLLEDGEPPAGALHAAAQLGSWVASQAGATPSHVREPV